MLKTAMTNLHGSHKGSLLAQKLLNPEIDTDSYLSVVLFHIEDGEHGNFVVWTYNAECDGYSSGHYTHNVKEAFQVFSQRGSL